MYLGVLFWHVLLFALALSSPVETKLKEYKKSVVEVTTPAPVKGEVSTPKNVNKEEVQNLNNAQTEKPATKKRDATDGITDKTEYFDDDSFEGKSADDYDSIQALKSYLDNSRNENLILDSNKYRANDYRYYDDEARRKRTAIFDGLMDKPDSYYEPEIQLTPEDIMALAAYKQQQRLYNNYPYGRWTDMNNSIDIPEADDTDEVYNDRPENFFGRYYNQRHQNLPNRSAKFITNRRRRSYSANPRLRVPVYRRAIL